MEDYYVGIVGIHPWEYDYLTWRDCHLMGESYEMSHIKSMEQTRFLAFSVYSATINDMSGKKVFKDIRKPTDLFPLPGDNPNVHIDNYDAERARKAVEAFKKTKIWQYKN